MKTTKSLSFYGVLWLLSLYAQPSHASFLKTLGTTVLTLFAWQGSRQVEGTEGLKIVGGSNDMYGLGAVDTLDGGLFVAGDTDGFGAANYDLFLQKIDHKGGIEWTKMLGGSGADYANDIVASSNNETYCFSANTRSFGHGNVDFLFIGLNSTGDIQWAKTAGSTSNEQVGKISKTPDGGFVGVGYTMSFGNNGDVFVVKLDSAGEGEWAKAIGTSSFDVGYAVWPVGDDLMVTGATSSGGIGSQNMLLLKLDHTGELVWGKAIGGSAPESCYAMTDTLDGGYLLVGGTSSFGTRTAIFIVQLDSEGNLNRSLRVTIGGYTDRAKAVFRLDNGDFLIAGESDSLTTGYDIFVMRLEETGELLWAKIFNGTSDDFMRTLVPTQQGGFVLNGDTLSFESGNVAMFLLRASNYDDFCDLFMPINVTVEDVTNQTLIVNITLDLTVTTLNESSVITDVTSELNTIFITPNEDNYCFTTVDPTIDPTSEPTTYPTDEPTLDPTIGPTIDPTSDPTIDLTIEPTQDPTQSPTLTPTNDPLVFNDTDYNFALCREGGEVLIEDDGLFDQEDVSAVLLDNDSFIAVWERKNAYNSSIYAQIFDIELSPLTAAFAVREGVRGVQGAPEAIPLINREFVVFWSEDVGNGSYFIYGQRFNQSAKKIEDIFRVDDNAQTASIHVKVKRLSNGHLFVTWEECNIVNYICQVYTQKFDFLMEKVDDAFRIGSDAGTLSEADPYFDILSNGHMVFVFEGGEAVKSGVYVQIVNSTGFIVVPSFRINNETGYTQRDQRVRALGNGNFFVAWEKALSTPAKDDIFGQFFDFMRNKLREEFRIHNNTLNDQEEPSIALLLLNEEFLMLAWEDERAGHNDVWGQILSLDGDKIGPEFIINDHALDSQKTPKAVFLGYRSFVVFWEDTAQLAGRNGLFMQLFKDCTPTTDPTISPTIDPTTEPTTHPSFSPTNGPVVEYVMDIIVPTLEESEGKKNKFLPLGSSNKDWNIVTFSAIIFVGTVTLIGVGCLLWTKVLHAATMTTKESATGTVQMAGKKTLYV